MNRDEIDVLWHRALHESVRDGEQFTRYHFAKIIRNQALEDAAVVCESEAVAHRLAFLDREAKQAATAKSCAHAIRAMKEQT